MSENVVVAGRRLGKVAKREDPRTLRLERYLSAVPAPPPMVPAPTVANWLMLLNNQLGCCVPTGAAHSGMAWTTDVGDPWTPADNDVLVAYEAVGGYDPTQTQPDGTNPTDNGCDMLTMCNYWVKTGVGGHKIGAFGTLDLTATATTVLHQTIWLTGVAYLGLAMPIAAQTMTVWDVPAGADIVNDPNYQPGGWGGHCVAIVGYDAVAGTYQIVSWGQVYTMTQAFLSAYGEECYGAVSPDWIGASGLAPSGFNADQLDADLAELANQPPPAPAPNPPPTPPNPPAPPPAPPNPPEPPVSTFPTGDPVADQATADHDLKVAQDEEAVAADEAAQAAATAQAAADAAAQAQADAQAATDAGDQQAADAAKATADAAAAAADAAAQAADAAAATADAAAQASAAAAAAADAAAQQSAATETADAAQTATDTATLDTDRSAQPGVDPQDSGTGVPSADPQ